MPTYPALGLPLRHPPGPQSYPIGAHRNNPNSASVLLFVREVAMLDIMEKITDKPSWHRKVFDEEIVAKWREEALGMEDREFVRLAAGGKTMYWVDGNGNGNGKGGEVVLVDDEVNDEVEGIVDEGVFGFCIQELRCKAQYFEETAIIPTLDACASVAKSDSIVSKDLHDGLKDAFDRLKREQSAEPDWHPRSGEMVQDLVHPSMYPLVYGRSRVFRDECVGVEDAVHAWAGKGDVISKQEEAKPVRQPFWSSEVPPEYWSSTYQWLPANVAFSQDGGVRFTSYINNLHPNRYPDIYRTIEKLIETSLPLWDQCLAIGIDLDCTEGAGRLDPRIDMPGSADDECADNWIPNNPSACAHLPITDEELEKAGYTRTSEFEEQITDLKWRLHRTPKIPDPTWEDITYTPEEGTRLKDRFAHSGLQIIVKLASIELTPEKPDFPAGGWHIEGQMNEHIAGTALYYLDSENVTDACLSFRMQTSISVDNPEAYAVGQDAYGWMESVFGATLGGSGSPCLQNYGSVRTREGRLVGFPNVFQHRVSPFKLIDPNKPGHRRFIALWLVDPTRRIVSTANVPPQRLDWYMESLLGGYRKTVMEKLPAEVVALLRKKDMSVDNDMPENPKLTAELLQMVRGYMENAGQEMLMDADEAKEHREKLMQERSAFVKTAENGWRENSYSFCEH